MNCSCPCASRKIYVCATEWQCLGPAALSAWLHRCFNIAGTFKIPLNATHRHQRAWRKATEGQSRVGRAEEPVWSSRPAQVLSRARRDQVIQQTDTQCPHKLIPFPSRCVNLSWQVQTIWARPAASCGQNQAAKGYWGPDNLALFH